MVFGTRTRRNGFSAVLLAAVFALTLAGCGGGGSKSSAPVAVVTPFPPVVDTDLADARAAAIAAYEAARKALDDVMANRDADWDSYDNAAAQVATAKAAADQARTAETLEAAQLAQRLAERAMAEAMRYAEMVRAAHAAASQRPSAPPAPQQTQRPVRDILDDLIDASSIVIQLKTGATLRDTRITQPTPRNLELRHMAINEHHGKFQRIGTRQRVSLARNYRAYGGGPGAFFDYAGWMDHSFFLLAVVNNINPNPLNPSHFVSSNLFTVGNASGTNPASGSATWRGAAIGVDLSNSENEGNVIIGDAMIGISDFSNPSASVSFTNLVDQKTNRRRANMSWSNIPVRGGGFEHNGQGDHLTGRFYGPNHEEVGGAFIREYEIAGAFGARR